MSARGLPAIVRLVLASAALLVCSGLTACADRPPTAPEDFQVLAGFIYEHMNDSDPAVLVAGVENAMVWLAAHPTQTQAGYTVDDLPKKAQVDLGDKPTKQLIGGAVLTGSDHSLYNLARAISIDNVRETNGDAYTKLVRTYDGDPECFAAKQCLSLTGTSQSEADFGPITVKYSSRLEFRWVKTKFGWVLVHRTFLTKPAQIDLDIIDVDRTYFLALVTPELPDSPGVQGTINGQSTMLQVMWSKVDYGILPVTEATALNMVIDSMLDIAVATEKWMDGAYGKPD